MIRIDLIFSCWIFVWYILYILHITNVNPKFSIIMGIIVNIIMIMFMINNNALAKIIFIFMMIILLGKIIPFYTIQNNITSNDDIIMTLMLFTIYLLWLHINKTHFIKVYWTCIDILSNSTNISSVLKLLNKL